MRQLRAFLQKEILNHIKVVMYAKVNFSDNVTNNRGTVKQLKLSKQ